MKGLSKIYAYPLVVIFLAILFLPTFNSSVGIWKFEKMDENRVFRDSIYFDIAQPDSFPGDFNEFFNDNFSFRRPLLDAYHNIKFTYFKTSPHAEKTIIGNKDWYFVEGRERAIYEGNRDFSEEDLKMFGDIWRYRKNYLDSLNIRFYWIVCPFKHYVYPEYLPFYVLPSDNIRRADQLFSYMDENFPGLVVNPLEDLIAAKDENKVFYQLDNHWNYHAGLVASNTLLSRISEDVKDEQLFDIGRITWKDTTLQKGYHYRVLGIESLYELDQYPNIENEQATKVDGYDLTPPNGFQYPWAYQWRYLNENDTTGLRVLIIRDSFGHQIAPFFKEAFSESVFIFDAWRYDLNEDIIEVVRPDIVVFLTSETHLRKFLD